MSAALFESLESRRLMAATPARPDLTASLNYTPTPYVSPGSTFSASVTVTNTGAAMTKQTTVPISLYISRTPKLKPGATPFKTQTSPLTLDTNGSSTVAITSTTLPTNVPAGKFYIIARVNKGNVVKESNPNNNTSATPALTNPIGKFKGTFTTDVGERGTLSLKIYPGATSSGQPALFADFDLRSPLARISSKHYRVNIDPSTGAFTLTASGSYKAPSRGGQMSFTLTLPGTLTNNQTLAGTLTLSWRTQSNSYNAAGTYTLKRT